MEWPFVLSLGWSLASTLDIATVVAASSYQWQSHLHCSKVFKKLLSGLGLVGFCFVVGFVCVGFGLVFFLWEYPHLTSAASSVYSWFLMVQPCIFLILVVLPLELLPQQLQLPFLCQEMIQLQVGWCLCSLTWTAAASQESTVPTPWLALLVFCLMRVSEFEGAFFF